jgi:glycosyltransferase involved in cell wall biosynthesis
MPNLLIAVPAYNEQATICDLVNHLKTIPNADIMIFDDGSTDKTHQLLHGSSVVFHREEINRGLAHNFQLILDHFLHESKYDFLITVDGDGQFEINEIQKVVRTAETEKFDFITASRFSEKTNAKSVPFLRRIPNIIIARLLTSASARNMRHSRLTDATCGLRAYSRKAALLLLGIQGHSYTLETFIRILNSDLRVNEVGISVRYFPNRISKISGSLFTYAKYVIRILKTTFTYTSLVYMFRILSMLSTVSIGLILLFLFLSIRDQQFRGWLFLGGAGAFSMIASLVMFNMYSTVSQAKSNRDYLDAKINMVIENAYASSGNLKCKKCVLMK